MTARLWRRYVSETSLLKQLCHRSRGCKEHDVEAMQIAERRAEIDRIHLRSTKLKFMREDEEFHCLTYLVRAPAILRIGPGIQSKALDVARTWIV